MILHDQHIRSVLLWTDTWKNAANWKGYNYLRNAWRTSTFREKTLRQEELEMLKFSLYFSGSLPLPIFSFLIKLALPTLARLFEIVSLEKNVCFWRAAYHTGEWRLSDVFCIAWFPYGRNGRHSPVWYGRKNRVTIFLNGQFRIVYTIQVIKYSPVIITPRIFSFKMLYFGWWERSWLNLYNRYDHMETRLSIYLEKLRTERNLTSWKIQVKLLRLKRRPFVGKLTIIHLIDVYGRPVTANGKLQFAFEGKFYKFPKVSTGF
jgi:hypothetical protein